MAEQKKNNNQLDLNHYHSDDQLNEHANKLNVNCSYWDWSEVAEEKQLQPLMILSEEKGESGHTGSELYLMEF